jgi:hypothetical protein
LKKKTASLFHKIHVIFLRGRERKKAKGVKERGGRGV